MMNSTRVLVLAAAATMGCTTTAHAQAALDGEAVLARYTEVTGGPEAYAKLRNRVTETTVYMPADGPEIHMKIFAAAPNLLYMESELPGMGMTARGVNRDVAWEKSAATGPIVKQGADRDMFLRLAVFDRFANWKKVWTAAELEGTETVDGEECNVVAMTPRSFIEKGSDGAKQEETKPELMYFSVKSGLLVLTKTSMPVPMGLADVTTKFQDYREVDGVKMAFKTEQVVMGRKLTTVLNSVKHNVELADDRFIVPADVWQLLERQKAK